MNTSATYTVSEARENLYELVRSASQGLKSFEITLRGSEDSVILINKSELEAWQETLDILSSKNEMRAINKGKKETKSISEKDMMKSLGF